MDHRDFVTTRIYPDRAQSSYEVETVAAAFARAYRADAYGRLICVECARPWESVRSGDWAGESGLRGVGCAAV
jgi:hypothetical protein